MEFVHHRYPPTSLGSVITSDKSDYKDYMDNKRELENLLS